jgi:hypothetical protein
LIVGSGLIADDRRDNAVPLYLAKPLTPIEYLAGKLGVVAVFVLLVTAVPINLLFLFKVLIDGGWTFFKAHWWLPLSITGYSLVLTLFCGAAILLASSLVTRKAWAGVVLIGVFFVNNVMAVMFVGAFRNHKLILTSLLTDVYRLGLWFFGDTDSKALAELGIGAGEAGLVVLATVVLCFAIIRWRIRPVEVVK